MNAPPTSVWRVPIYLPYLQPPLTDEAIAEAEKKIGFRLPESYLSLLREQNGGYIRYTLPETAHKLISGIGSSFPSLTDFDWDDAREYVGFELDGLVPFDGDGHWHLCFDYRGERSTPAVTLADIECNRETLIADSFDDYLTLLKIDVPEGELVMPEVPDLDCTLDQLSTRLGVRFDPPSSWAHGYPTHRARGNGETPEWIWISPNVVPRGFVRNDDGRFEELRNLMPGEAPRYPELPPSSYLMSATDGIRRAVLRACADLSIDVRPLSEYTR